MSLLFAASAVAQTAPATAQGGAVVGERPGGHTGGAEFGVDPDVLPQPVVPGDLAVMIENGLAAAPANAPDEVKRAIWAANEIQDKPYRYGGGHARFRDSGYDCSGTVSYALRAAGLVKRPLDSSSFMRWGERGPGLWITVFTNPGHAYVVIAGLRLDTSSAGARGGGKGPRWRATARSSRGYRVRHPVGF